MRLWHNAQLARKVHHLHICWQECGMSGSSGDEKEPETVAFIDAALDEIFGSDAPLDRTRDEWEHHLLARCQKAWAGVLQVRLSHLQRLVVSYEQSDLIADILRQAAQRQQPFHRTSPFPHLVEINAYAQGRLYWIDSDLLTSFFYFPAVRRVNAFAVAETSAAPESLAVLHESRPVQSIAVANVVHFRGMLDWLAASLDLEHVALKIAVHPADHYWNLPPTKRFHAPTFRQALLPFAETLRLPASLESLNQIQLYVIYIDEDPLAVLRTECESAGIDLKVEEQQEEAWEHN